VGDEVLLAVFGIRVVEVDRLPQPAILLKRHGLALLDAGLSQECRRHVLDHLVSRVALQA